MGAQRAAVFLDRDGTLNEEVDFLTDPDELVLVPGAGAAVRALNDAGLAAVVVTNQSGIARGLLDEAGLARIHARLAELLAAQGARIDAWYFCPHHPDEGAPPYRGPCECRKPAPGMLVRAARELGLDLRRSWVVGDSLRDLEAGAALGVPGVLVATGKGERERAKLAGRPGPPPHLAADLAAAVRLVLAGDRRDAQGR